MNDYITVAGERFRRTIASALLQVAIGGGAIRDSENDIWQTSLNDWLTTPMIQGLLTLGLFKQIAGCEAVELTVAGRQYASLLALQFGTEILDGELL